VSCFAHTSPNNYATFGAHSVCYNMKFDGFSEFSSLIYYLGIENSIYKGFSNFIKGKCQLFEKSHFEIKNEVVHQFTVRGLIA
jgi:hypothetical protein